LHVWINTDLEGGIYRDRGATPLGPKLNQLSGEDSKKSEAGVLKGEWTSEYLSLQLKERSAVFMYLQ
jgi:hypothetical protein